jgi:flagellar protein FliO/FliZ
MVRGLNFYRSFLTGLLLIFICSFSGLVMAAEQEVSPAAPGYLQYQDPASKAAGSTWGTVAYVFSLLVLFVGVIFLAYLTSRFLAVKMGGMGQSAGSTIHMTLALGPNRNIHLVEMAGRFFVVGATEQSIQLLFEIDSPEQIALIRGSSKTARPSFEDALGSQILALKQIRDRFPGIFSPPVDPHKNDDQEKR